MPVLYILATSLILVTYSIHLYQTVYAVMLHDILVFSDPHHCTKMREGGEESVFHKTL